VSNPVSIGSKSADRTPTQTLDAGIPSRESRGDRLVIRVGDRVRVFDFADGELSMGRSDDCDVVVASRYTSRHHARIIRSNGRFFFLIDESRNGTYLRAEGLGQIRLHATERVPLIGTGEIGLGRAPDNGAEGTITFEIRSEDER
jgi:pSer/pThr/pTyr-binding forkhead associated (FHA) protein